MKRLLFPVLALASALLLNTGCSTPYTKGRSSALNLPMPAPGKSTVVFVRPGQYLAGGMNMDIHEDTRLIGVLANKTFFVHECAPGHHVFSTSMENMAILEADLLPNRIYYAKASASMGAFIAQVRMYALHPKCAGNLWPELPEILGSVKETIVKPEAVTEDAERAKEYGERLQKHLPKPRDEKILPEHGLTKPIGSP